MKRRQFFRNSSLATFGGLILGNPKVAGSYFRRAGKQARNIIFMVSDGMSSGTLTMADILHWRKTGKGTHWLNLYRENRVNRALMDMASANSLVTDSAAASSSWGGGRRVNNGSLNIGPNGEEHQPIWQKFQAAGRKVGCVTTVPITHATPAGFCVNSNSRNAQPDIALKYIDLRFDVMLGGGHEFFSSEARADKQDLYASYQSRGFQVARSRRDLSSLTAAGPVLGVFQKDGLPYSVDRDHTPDLAESVPTIAEMTRFAIDRMKGAEKGFVLQVEGGKVDWAAHANCAAGLLYDQLAFDEAIRVALDFAESDGNTLVILTTDHGNANPGLVAGSEVNRQFDTLQQYRHSNEWLLRGLTPQSSISDIQDRAQYACGISLTTAEAGTLQSYYLKLTKGEDGTFNYTNLPFQTLAVMQKSRNSVSWISMDHSSDYVELAMLGPGSENLRPFMKNTDLHGFLLEAAGLEV